MLNQAVLVGRLVDNPTVEENENGRKLVNITLAVSRSYKNIDGEYETDFLDVILWDGIASNTCEYCKKGDLIGVKGRLESSKIENKNVMQLVAEKITFLSSKAE